jgi:hypothetical protein
MYWKAQFPIYKINQIFLNIKNAQKLDLMECLRWDTVSHFSSEVVHSFLI